MLRDIEKRLEAVRTALEIDENALERALESNRKTIQRVRILEAMVDDLRRERSTKTAA